MRRDHQKFSKEYLANAIFKKILEIEHNYQMELKRRLETTAPKDRMQRIKVGRSRRAVEHYMPMLSPHPPINPKALSLSNTAPGRPSTAPANMQQRPSRLQPLLNHSTTGVTLKPAMSRSKPSLVEMEGRFFEGGERYRNSSSEYFHGVAPYQLPIINEYLMPVPPPPSPRNEKMINKSRVEAWRRRVRPTTAPNTQDPHRDSGRYHKSPLHSNAFITMIYWGKSVHLNHDDLNYKDEIKIYQQHCGGENLCVFQGKLLEKETFQFISKRHYGFPFSLTFFLNGMQLDRLSSCCEFKHRRGARLGGKNGYFGFVDIDGASPCYKCIISMGLDKKPFPPPKREKEMIETTEGPIKEGFTKLRESFHEEVERVGSSSTTYLTPEDDKKVEENPEKGKGREEETGPDTAEDNQELLCKDDYDEDFEVDDEKSNENVNEDGQSDDQMNSRSKSSSEDEKNEIEHEQESETSLKETRETSEYMKYEIDGCSDNDLEDDKQARKTSSTGSFRSNMSSSSSEDMFEMGDGITYSEESQEETQQENPYYRHLDEDDKEDNPALRGLMDKRKIRSKRLDPEGICEYQGIEWHSSSKEIKKSLSGRRRNQDSGEGKEEESTIWWPLAKTTKELNGTMAGLSKVDEGDDLKSIQEEIRESDEENEPCPSETKPRDSSPDKTQEGPSRHLAHLHKDGDLLAEETMALEMADEEAEYDAPEGEQRKRKEAFEGEVKPEPGEEAKSRKQKEKEQEEEAEAALGRGWVVVHATSAPQVLVEAAELTQDSEVPGVHWVGEEKGAKGEGEVTSREEGEVTEQTRTALGLTDATSPEEDLWMDRDSEQKDTRIQEEENVSKAAGEGQRDTGEVRHDNKTTTCHEGKMEEVVLQSTTGKPKKEEAEREAEGDKGHAEAAWRKASEMEELKVAKEAKSELKETYQEVQEDGGKTVILRGVTPEEEETMRMTDVEGGGREDGYPGGAEKETATVQEEITPKEETEALSETLREGMSQREVVTPRAVTKGKGVFEQLEETTDGEETEERNSEAGVGRQGMEPVARAAIPERKVAPVEAASEIKNLSGKEGIPGLEEEEGSEDGETRYGATNGVTCRAQEENKVKKQEMELPEEGEKSPNNGEGALGTKSARQEWTPEEEPTTKEPAPTERVEAPGEIGEMGSKEGEEAGVLGMTPRVGFEENTGMGVSEEADSAPWTGTEVSLEKEVLKHKGWDKVLEEAEADTGGAGGVAALKRADEAASEGKTEGHEASSPSDVPMGEPWPRQDQSAVAGRGAEEEETNGDRTPAGEGSIGKAAPEADSGIKEGGFHMRLMIPGSEWGRGQRGEIVRGDWKRENGQAKEAGEEEDYRPEPRRDAQEQEVGSKSQSPQALAALEPEMSEIREKQGGGAPREGDALGI
ncbi:glutamate-rich protein 3 isoform X3 [Macrotis lagotis]|uniref:glutamate-rich protein 3 isoform X3 n=1 Tax=Macrotis lagotis TaxID=92651 RepID=UPI003D69D2CF